MSEPFIRLEREGLDHPGETDGQPSSEPERTARLPSEILLPDAIASEIQHALQQSAEPLRESVSQELEGLPDNEKEVILSLLEARGVLPNVEGKRHIASLSEDKQDVLRNPNALLSQCCNLSRDAGTIGKLLRLDEQTINHLRIAGMLLNSAKAKQYSSLLDDVNSKKYTDEEIYHRYGNVERDLYNEIASTTLPKQVEGMLRENTRHDPSTLTTIAGKILYYLIYSQDPTSGKLVDIRERVTKAINEHPLYGAVYRGYTRTHDDMNLVDVHHETVSAFESWIAGQLPESATFPDIRTFLNKKLTERVIEPAPPAPGQ